MISPNRIFKVDNDWNIGDKLEGLYIIAVVNIKYYNKIFQFNINHNWIFTDDYGKRHKRNKQVTTKKEIVDNFVCDMSFIENKSKTFIQDKIKVFTRKGQ